jgi:pimeloyl-ACP methyl ester carboxylesterase
MKPEIRETWFFARGLVRESGHWSGFLERFSAAFPNRRVVTLDIPGNGTKFRERSPCSIQGMVESLRGEYLREKSERNVLFALSLGAMAGLEWMHEHPQDFSAAVLVNTSVRGLSPLFHRLQPHNYGRILRMMLFGNPRFIERSILEMTSHNRGRFAELEKEWVAIHEARPVSVANSLRQLLAAVRFRPPREKPALPLLVLNGAGDRLVNPACSRAIASHWGLDLKVHPEAGHDLTLDAPEWVIEQLRNFPPL